VMVLASFTSGQLLARFGYKIFALAGTIITAVGLYLLSGLGAHPDIIVAIGEMMVLGVGLGFTMATYIVAAQNAVERHKVGVATSTLTLMRSLGSTIGVTVFGAMLNSRLREEIPKNVPKPVLDQILAQPFIGGRVEDVPSLLVQQAFLDHTPTAIIDGIKVAFANSLSTVFLTAAMVAVVAFIVTLFLKSKPLTSKEEYLKGSSFATEGGVHMDADGADLKKDKPAIGDGKRSDKGAVKKKGRTTKKIMSPSEE